MGQIKIYGMKENLNPIKVTLSNVIHSCMVDALQLPEDKKFHRFFPMDKEDFYFANGRTDAYTIIEISMFEGRTMDAKKQLIHLIFERMHHQLHIDPQDVELLFLKRPNITGG